MSLGGAYLDDVLALGQGLPYHWSETRVGHADVAVFIKPVEPGVTYRLDITCDLAAPAVGDRPTTVWTALSGKWTPIDNLFVPKYDRLLCREQGQTMRCRHMYGSPDPNDKPTIPVDEASGGLNWMYESDHWLPISQVLACVFRNPPDVR
jgi:hypothetical protein